MSARNGTTTDQGRPPSRWLRGALVTALVLCGAAVYSNTFRVPFVFDDDTAIVQNPLIRPPAGIGDLWSAQPSRFLGNLSFAANYRLGGLRVGGYHAVNLAVHLLAGLAVFWLSLLLLRAPALRGTAIPGPRREWLAFFGSLVFLIHPVQTQAVTYVVQRFASLAALFYIVAVAGYAAFRLSASPGKWMWLGVSVLSAIAAMLTKENAVSLPVMVLLAELVLLRPRPVGRGRLAGVLLALALAAGLAAALGLLPRETTAISRPHYLFTQFRVLLTYLRLLVAPVGQNMDYDYPIYSTLAHPAVLAGLAALAALAAFSVLASRRYPLLAFAVLWFLTALSVESGLVPIADVIFEHRLYLPLAGYALFVIGLLAYFGDRVTVRLAVTVAGALILCYGVSTYARNEIWGAKLRILNDTLLKSPRKARPLRYRGLFWASVGWHHMAYTDYTNALALDPADWKTYYERGALLARNGRDREALADLDRAIGLAPYFAPSYNVKGNALLSLGQVDSALSCFDGALSLDSTNGNAYGNRGLAHVRRGEIAQGLADYDRALRLAPGLAFVRLNRALALNLLGRYDAAADEFGQYLACVPSSGDALMGRAWARYRMGRHGEARTDLEQALALRAAVPPEYREMAESYKR